MKLSTVLLVFIAGIAAIAVGWIYQSKTEPDEATAELDIPIDIDYYLSGVRYRVMSSEGLLDYELRTPYLEHYIQGDISRITAPKMDIYRNNRHWRASAQMAELQHGNNILTMIDNVSFERSGEDDGRNLGVNAQIEAETAVFDLDNRIYTLEKTRAIYH